MSSTRFDSKKDAEIIADLPVTIIKNDITAPKIDLKALDTLFTEIKNRKMKG